MSIVVYRCDTCKRDIELVRNIRGLETVQRCIITHGCRGKLYQTDLLQDFSRASLPDEVDGLDDWIPRRVLYNHTQTIENSIWIINHNLGTYPSVSVFADRPTSADSTNREEITPSDIQIIDANTLYLHFDRPRSGIAQLVARSSDPYLFEPNVAESTDTPAPFQLSNSAYVVLATRVKPGWDGETIGVSTEFATSTGAMIPLNFVAGNYTSFNTAWAGADRVVIHGKVYELREFRSLAIEMTIGTVINGNTFRFKAFDFSQPTDLTYDHIVDPADMTPGDTSLTQINPGEIYMLLSYSPFDTIDKITTQIIDVTSVTTTQNTYSMYYDSGELFAAQDVADTVFPPIRTV